MRGAGQCRRPRRASPSLIYNFDKRVAAFFFHQLCTIPLFAGALASNALHRGALRLLARKLADAFAALDPDVQRDRAAVEGQALAALAHPSLHHKLRDLLRNVNGPAEQECKSQVSAFFHLAALHLYPESQSQGPQDWAKLKVADLKAALAVRQLPVTGNKRALVERLANNEGANAAAAPAAGWPAGLLNLGQTCYMNAALQAIFSAQEPRLALLAVLPPQQQDLEAANPRKRALAHLFKNMQLVLASMAVSSAPACVDPAPLFDSVFSGMRGDQPILPRADAQGSAAEWYDRATTLVEEFRPGCLDCLQFEVIPPDGGPAPTARRLLVSTRGLASLSAALERSVLIAGRIASPPRVLVVELDRLDLGANVKDTERFEFPVQLNMLGYSLAAQLGEVAPEEARRYMYDITGIVVHYGTPSAGHYCSYNKLSGAAGWVETNDTIVRPWDISRLAQDTFGGQQGLEPCRRPTAALLVFRQRDAPAEDAAAAAAVVPPAIKEQAEHYLAEKQEQGAGGAGRPGYLLPVSMDKLNSRGPEYLRFLVWINSYLQETGDAFSPLPLLALSLRMMPVNCRFLAKLATGVDKEPPADDARNLWAGLFDRKCRRGGEVQPYDFLWTDGKYAALMWTRQKGSLAGYDRERRWNLYKDQTEARPPLDKLRRLAFDPLGLQEQEQLDEAAPQQAPQEGQQAQQEGQQEQPPPQGKASELPEGFAVLGLDIGRASGHQAAVRDIATVAQLDHKQRRRHQTASVPRKMFNNLAGSNCHQREVAARNKQYWQQHGTQSQAPSAKVASLEAFQHHLRYMASHWRSLFDFHCRNSVARRRFFYSKKRRAAYALCAVHFIMRGLRSPYARGEARRDGHSFPEMRASTLLAIGNAVFSANQRGLAPGPTVSLVRSIVQLTDLVMWIDEYFTSQKCSDCGARLEAPRVRRGSGPRQQCHHVRRCPECNKWWQRDINAALAMSLLGFAALNKLERPEPYRRGGDGGAQA